MLTSLRNLVVIGIVLSPVVTQAQFSGYVQSTLPVNGAIVFQSASLHQTSPTTSVLVVGTFSTYGQPGRDIVTVDATGTIQCLQNLGNGSFSQPIASTQVSLPITAQQVINFQSFPGTDTLFLASNLTLYELSFSNCVATVTSKTQYGADVTGISRINQNVVVTTYGGVLIEQSPPLMILPQGADDILSGVFDTGEYGAASYQFALISANNSTAPMVELGYFNAGSVVLGSQVLACSLPVQQLVTSHAPFDSGMLCASGTNVQFSLLTYSGSTESQEPPYSFVPAGSFSFPDSFIDAAQDGEGNVLGAFSKGEIIWFPQQANGWNDGGVLWNVSTPISAIAAGDLVSGSNIDVVVQTPGNVIAFAPESLSEETTPPPQAYSVTVTVSGSGSGVVGGSSANVSCPPTCTSTVLSGMNLTFDATPLMNSTFAGWGGNCTGSAPTCQVTVSGNLNLTATFNAPPPPPSPSLTVSPTSATITPGGSQFFTVVAQNFSVAPTISATCPIPQSSCAVQVGGVLVTTTGPMTAAVPAYVIWLLPWATLLLILGARHKSIRVCAMVGALALCAGCGSGKMATSNPSGGGTPAGTYTITITGTAQNQSATVTATLSVQ